MNYKPLNLGKCLLVKIPEPPIINDGKIEPKLNRKERRKQKKSK